MRLPLSPRDLRFGLVGTAVATGLGLAGAAAVPTLASGPKGGGVTVLTLGQRYTHAIARGAQVRVVFAPDSLAKGAQIDLLGVGGSGTVLGQRALTPSASENVDGQVTFSAPATSGSVSFWIALDPVDGNDAMHLIISPAGKQPAGANLSATLTNVPPGDTVYLLGIYNRDPDAQGAIIASYVPQTACLPDPTPSGMVICNFTAPAGYGAQTVSFEAHTTNDSVESLPANNLPEVPVSAALPLLALPAVYVLRRRIQVAG